MSSNPGPLPEPYHTTPRTSLYLSDALTVLRGLPTGSVDAVIADPPYSSGGTTSAERTTKSTRSKYVSTSAQHALPDFEGDRRDQRGFAFWSTLWLTECFRLTKPGGVCLVFTDWRQLPSTSDALQAAGWVWRGQVVWHKPNPRTYPGRFTNHAEYALWGSHGPMGHGAGRPCLPGLYTVTPPHHTERVHITQKPLKLLRDLVQIVPPGAMVLDPFMGSGTAGVAAVLEGRRFVGVELAEHFAQVAATRIGEAERESGDVDGGAA